jgi:predicted nucleotidyltransferase
MKVIVKILGGSHLYGLNTANSDRDERGIFINTEVSTILGLEKHEYNVSQTNQEDISYKEVRRAIDLIRRGNSEMIETLFCDDYLGNL